LNLRFLLGRAGSGKTHYMLHSVREQLLQSQEGSPVVLLVPEQATFQTEYTLTSRMGLKGSIRAQVLSFRRLAYRVLQETGGATRVPIGELGKRMVLRGILEKRKSELRIFGRLAGQPGFADSLARTIGEMKTYLVSPDSLTEAAEGIDTNSVFLHDKIADIVMLYNEMDEYLEDRYTDPDDYLSLLAERIALAPSFKSAEFWIDGFKGFTPQELKVIEKIFPVAGTLNVSICIEPSLTGAGLSQEDLFYPTWKTYQEVIRAASQAGATVLKPVILDNRPPPRFLNAPDIAHLEQNLFSYPAKSYSQQAGGGITILAAANRRAEVEACAREIVRLARDEGFRWRDISILTRELEVYGELIANIFKDYDIPVFIDTKKKVMHHPLVELIRSALETVIKKWSYEPVFRYLKTDLVPVDRDEVFLLENYCLAHGIRGNRWVDGKDWQYRRHYTLGEDNDISEKEKADLVLINDIREKASKALADFNDRVSLCHTVRGVTEALFILLEDLKAHETINEWKTKAEMEGNLEKAREHAQIWSGLISLFDELVEALGNEEMALDTYAGIIDSGLESMTIGMIPPGLDQVIAGSPDRSRNPDTAAAFLLGAVEGVIPARISDDGIFNNTEREKLASAGAAIAPGSRHRVFEENYIVYMAVTRAGKRLILSFPMADDEGKTLLPSPVISGIKKLFPGVKERFIQVEPLTGDTEECTGFVVHPVPALTYLTSRLREAKSGNKMNPVWWDLYNWYMGSSIKEKAARVISSVFHSNTARTLSADKCRSLYGTPVKTSVSRVEKYISCPFAHYSAYGLRLQDRQIYRLEAPDMGEFFHAALKCFTEEQAKMQVDWGRLDREECIRIAGKIVSELAPSLQNEILLSSARYRYLTGKLNRAVTRAVLTLGEHARLGNFRPVGVEVSFGPGTRFPHTQIELPGGDSLALTGRIDRLDVFEDEDNIYLRVIDYKSSDQNIKPEDIFHGVRLQLLTYLHIAVEHYSMLTGKKVKPAGIFYFTVLDPFVTGAGPLAPEEVERSVLARLKMKGLLLEDLDVFKMMDSSVESGWSTLFPVGITKNGSFYESAPVISEEKFELLRSYLKKMFAEAGSNILKGDVRISPYKTRSEDACRYCSFRPVCKFDLLVEGNKYRVLPQVSDNLWDLLAGKEVTNG